MHRAALAHGFVVFCNIIVMAGIHLAHMFDLGPLILHPRYTLARALSSLQTLLSPFLTKCMIAESTKTRSCPALVSTGKVPYARVAVSYLALYSPSRVHERLGTTPALQICLP